MRTIAIENGKAKLSKQQHKALRVAADLLRGLRQVYHDDELQLSRLTDAERTVRDYADGEATEESETDE